MEEMLAAFGGEMPAFYFARGDQDFLDGDAKFYRFDRRGALYYLVNMNLSRFADMETGECSFDSEDFQSLLQLTACGEAAAETDLDLDNRYVRDDLGISSSDTVAVSGLEACRVFPWEGDRSSIRGGCKSRGTLWPGIADGRL